MTHGHTALTAQLVNLNNINSELFWRGHGLEPIRQEKPARLRILIHQHHIKK